DADARERDRLRRRSGLPSPRPLGDLGARDREAAEPRGGRHHRQGLRARTQDRRDGLVAPERWCARRDPEQVRALGRPAVTGGAAGRAPRRVLFVTGKLAEPAVRRTSTGLGPAFARDVAVMQITVAASMTTRGVAR